MSAAAECRRELMTRIRGAFPCEPIPAYPPDLGLLPTGEADEYLGFAGRAWDEIEPRLLGSWGFDICPVIGFAIHRPPHIWNYYLPAFMAGVLEHDAEHEVSPALMARLHAMEVAAPINRTDLPWWHGEQAHANYSPDQVACVQAFLEYMAAFGSEPEHEYEWEARDELALQRWRLRATNAEPDSHV